MLDNEKAVSARLHPNGVAIDEKKNLVYITDYGNFRVRVVNLNNGVISTIAGTGVPGYSGETGLALFTPLNGPSNIVLDAINNMLYFTEARNHCVKRIDLLTSIITTIAGNGKAGFAGDGLVSTTAQLKEPYGLALDAHNQRLFICDFGNHRIRKIDLVSFIISTVAGTGIAAYSGDHQLARLASFNNPVAICLDANQNRLLVADMSNNVIRAISLKTYNVSTIAGNGTVGFAGDGNNALHASLNGPRGVSIDTTTGAIIISDTLINRIRQVSSNNIISTMCGNGFATFAGDNGPATNASLNFPFAVTVSSSTYYVTDISMNNENSYNCRE